MKNNFSISKKSFSTSIALHTEENQNYDEITQFPRHKKEIKKRNLLTFDFHKDFIKRTFIKNKIDNNLELSKMETINKELTELSEEREALKVEHKKCKMALRTMEELLNEKKIPREEETQNIRDIKENYASFFDENNSDSEDSNLDDSISEGSISENSVSDSGDSAMSSDLDKNSLLDSESNRSDINKNSNIYDSFKEVYKYIKEEIKGNQSYWTKLRKDCDSSIVHQSQKTWEEVKESKNKGKRKLDDSEEVNDITLTKKSRGSTPTNDFIDDQSIDFPSFTDDID